MTTYSELLRRSKKGGGRSIKIEKGGDGERGNIIKTFQFLEHLLDSMIYWSRLMIESQCYIYSSLDDPDLIWTALLNNSHCHFFDDFHFKRF